MKKEDINKDYGSYAKVPQEVREIWAKMLGFETAKEREEIHHINKVIYQLTK